MRFDESTFWRKRPFAVLLVAALLIGGCKTGPADAPAVSVPEVAKSTGNDADVGEDPATDDSGEDEVIEDYPAEPAFEHAGFEFCCGGYDTYGQHAFVASGVVQKLDGGQWAADINGAIGERVFASYGDGFDDASDTTKAWQGWEQTGSLTTPEFVIPTAYINMLTGGGTNLYSGANATAVVLKISGEVVRQATGNGQEASLSPVTWAVSDYIGQTAHIEIIDAHADDGSDESLPFILVDQIEVSSTPATTPSGADVEGGEAPLVLTDAPATEGTALFTGANPEQNLAGFEFCCGQFNTYQEHGFGATGDFIRLNGGQWGADIQGVIGERAFASYGESFTEDGGTSAFMAWSAVGRVVTPEFTIGSRYINFLIGGGNNPYSGQNATAVVLRVEGVIARHAVGANADNILAWQSWDVSALKGRRAVIEFIDNHQDDDSDTSLPYIIADEFRAAEKAAVEPTADSVVTNNIPAPAVDRLKMGDPNPYYDGSTSTYQVFYLHDEGHHPWYLSQTEDLLNFSSPELVLSAGEAGDAQDNWTGSGSVIADGAGGYRLFYTGHNQTITPVEAVMQAKSEGGSLTQWTKAPELTFAGTSGYSNYDFRDPWVFYNEIESQYWMLLTSRYNDQAAIALYTSTDLNSWQPQAPLYTEASPLNLEVPDLLRLDSGEFLIYSDQRDASRQVRHLVPDTAGTGWVYPAYDALDGKGFYAGRTAGPATEKLLFGWVPHKLGRTDAGLSRWGGDLVVHQLKTNDLGDLVVQLPAKLEAGLATPASASVDWQSGNVTDNGSSLTITGDGAFTRGPVNGVTRIQMQLTQMPIDANFGLQFRDPATEQTAFITFDPVNNHVGFHFENDVNNPQAPWVEVPLDQWSTIELDVVLNPDLEYGVVYINNYRALTFRFYGLEKYSAGVFSRSGLQVDLLERFTQ